jgi:hypothetical protein
MFDIRTLAITCTNDTEEQVYDSAAMTNEIWHIHSVTFYIKSIIA